MKNNDKNIFHEQKYTMKKNLYKPGQKKRKKITFPKKYTLYFKIKQVLWKYEMQNMTAT